MICPQCQVWELLPRDKVCSWCGTVQVQPEPAGDLSLPSFSVGAEIRDLELADPAVTTPTTAMPVAEPVSPAAASRPSPPFVGVPPVLPPPPPRPAAPPKATYVPAGSPGHGQVLPPYQPVASAPRTPGYTAAQYPTYPPPPPARRRVSPARPRAGRRFAAALFLILVTVILYALITPPSKPAVPTLLASPNPIQRGQRTVLHWSAKGYSRVDLDGAPVDLTGSRAVYPSASTTYRLIGTERDGAQSVAEARVIVQSSSRGPARRSR